MSRSAWYVYASRAHGAERLPLLGPFERPQAAGAMLEPVRAAVERCRPDLRDCDVLVGLLDTERAGALDLSVAVDDAWRQWCVEYRRLL